VTALRQRMLEDLQIRHYSPTTIRIYLHSVAELRTTSANRPTNLVPDGLPASILLYPHAQPEDRHRAHPVSATRTKTANDSESRRSESAVRSATLSSPPCAVGRAVRLRSAGRRSHPPQGDRYRRDGSYRFPGDGGGARVKWPLTMGLRSSPSQSSYTMRLMVVTLS
jgi:hypothetical protein